MTDCLEYKGNIFYFHIGEKQTARELVLKYHYSGRCHENPILVGSLHFGGGGLYGDKGELVATCIFSPFSTTGDAFPDDLGWHQEGHLFPSWQIRGFLPPHCRLRPVVSLQKDK